MLKLALAVSGYNSWEVIFMLNHLLHYIIHSLDDFLHKIEEEAEIGYHAISLICFYVHTLF